MTDPAPPDLPQPRRLRPALQHPVLLALIALCCLIELLLVLADHGLIGTPRWRPLAYQYGAFWAGLLHGWRPNYASQPAAMFLTHAFLHAGPSHLIGNMLALMFLAPMVLDRQGPGRFALVYLATTLGGGAAFGLLSRSPAPMVGASGALFGLAAAVLVWRWKDDRQSPRGRLRALAELLGGMAGLAAINFAAWWLQGGLLAWQTHLGGAVAGAAMAALLPAQRSILAKMRA